MRQMCSRLILFQEKFLMIIVSIADPFEQWNRINSLTNAERSYLHSQLEILKGCRGVRQCTLGPSQPPSQASKPRRRNYHAISFGKHFSLFKVNTV